MRFRFEELDRLREQRGWTFAELCRRLTIDQGQKTTSAHIASWRKGTIPKLPTVTAIANLFDVSIDTFVDREDSNA
jgi:transcriptional regulator with XRE-family HTH domain